jgi:hypothetical protein
MITLEQLTVALAEHMAHERSWPLVGARHWVERQLEKARAEYRANGAPLGDTDVGFLVWLLPRPQPPTA